MPEEKTQKRILYRTVSGRENSRFMQDNEESRFKNTNSVRHPNYGEVYPEPDEDWSGTAYVQGRGPLSPETTAATAAKKFRFIDVGSMNNPLFPVSHRRVTGLPIETPIVQNRQTVAGVKPPVPATNPPIPNNPVAAGNTAPQKQPLPVISDTYPNRGQKEPSPSVASQNNFTVQNDWIKDGFLNAPIVKQHMPGYVDRSSNLEKKVVKYIDTLGEVTTRDMTPEEEYSYRDAKPSYVSEKGMVYPKINEKRFIQHPDFDVSKLYSTSSNFVPTEEQKIKDVLRSLNTNPYYNQMFHDMSQKGGTYYWRPKPTLSDNIQAQFYPENDMIQLKDVNKVLPPNIEEELLHAAQKQTYGMDTMDTKKEKFEKSIEHEAKVFQDYIRTLKDFQTQEGEYPTSGNMGMKGPHDTSYNAFLEKVAKQGGFTEADLEKYNNWGRQLNHVKGNIDPKFFPKLLFRHFEKKE